MHAAQCARARGREQCRHAGARRAQPQRRLLRALVHVHMHTRARRLLVGWLRPLLRARTHGRGAVPCRSPPTDRARATTDAGAGRGASGRHALQPAGGLAAAGREGGPSAELSHALHVNNAALQCRLFVRAAAAAASAPSTGYCCWSSPVTS
jgi:hypothetical protein